MPNVLQTSNLIVQGMTQNFEQGSPIFNTANLDYVSEYTKPGYDKGDTINIRVPGYPSVTTGLSVSAQDFDDRVVPFTLSESDIYNVTRELNLYEGRTDFAGGSKEAIARYATQQALAMEAKIESQCVTKLTQSAYLTPIDRLSKLQALNSYSGVQNVTTMARKLKFSQDDLVFMMNCDDAASVRNSLQNMFNPAINTGITKRAVLGNLASMDIFESADMSAPHVASKSANRVDLTVQAVAADGTSITLQNFTANDTDVLKAGDRIAIPSVNVLDPISKVATNYTLVVTVAPAADGTLTYDADGSGHATFLLSEPLFAAGEHANVSALPAVSAATEVFPSYKLNFAYTQAGLSAIPLPLGDIHGADMSSLAKSSGRIPVRSYMQGVNTSFVNTFRISMFVAIKVFPQYVIAVPTAV